VTRSDTSGCPRWPGGAHRRRGVSPVNMVRLLEICTATSR
jgi:hypothetical protein